MVEKSQKYWESEDASCAVLGAFVVVASVHLTAGLNNTEKPCLPQQRSKTRF